MVSVYSVAVPVYAVVVRTIGIAIGCRITAVGVCSIVIHIAPVRVIIVPIGVGDVRAEEAIVNVAGVKHLLLLYDVMGLPSEPISAPPQRRTEFLILFVINGWQKRGSMVIADFVFRFHMRYDRWFGCRLLVKCLEI